MSRPKELRNVDLIDCIRGKHELPEGVTRAKLMGVLLQMDLHMVLTHSHVERKGEGALLYLNGELRGITDHLNADGKLDGSLAVLYPKGGLWLLTEFKDGEPHAEDSWVEFLPGGIPSPAKPFAWLSWGDEPLERPPGATLH